MQSAEYLSDFRSRCSLRYPDCDSQLNRHRSNSMKLAREAFHPGPLSLIRSAILSDGCNTSLDISASMPTGVTLLLLQNASVTSNGAFRNLHFHGIKCLERSLQEIGSSHQSWPDKSYGCTAPVVERFGEVCAMSAVMQ